MAQTGFTPIQLYRTATASAVPLAGNLSDGELALNTNDGRLYYKDSGGTVQVIAYKNVPLSTVTGTLAVANGGTGQTTLQAAINSLAGAVTSGQYLRGNGTNVVMSAIQAGDVPTLNQNTTGTASNVTGTVAVANGGTGATTAPNARTNLGATTVGSNFFTLTNPSAVTFIRVNADNTVSTLDAATFRTAIGAGTGGGSVTSVSGTGTVNGISLSGTVTSSGSLTLSGAISGVPNSATTATNLNTASAIVARDASGNFSAGTITATLSGSATQVSNNLTLATSGTGLSGSATFNGSSAQTFTVTSNATSANTASTIVARDASGNFSAGTITASLSGTATTATNWGSYGAVPAAGTSFGTANTIGRSDASGYTYFGYINSSTSNSENPSVSQVIVTNGGDNFYRKASVAHLTSSLSGTAPISISGNAANVTGTVAVANGGTGSTSLTANNVLLGNGTSALQVVAPGASGNVLTSNGTTWTSSAPASGGYIKSSAKTYDRTITFAGTVNATGTTTGSLRLLAIQVSATVEVVLFWGSGSGSGLYAAAWDNSTKTFGASVLVRNANINPSGTGQANVAGLNVNSTSVVVCSIVSNNLQTVVLSLSGTTITVGTPVSSTMGGNYNMPIGSEFNNGLSRMFKMGSSFVVNYWNTSEFAFRAITVSGTTPTVGTEVYPGSSLSGSVFPAAVAIDSSTILALFRNSSGQVQLRYLTVSGSTLTLGASSTTTGSSIAAGPATVGLLSTGRVFFTWGNTSGGQRAAIVTNSGGTPSVSETLITNYTGSSIFVYGQVIGDKMLVTSPSAGEIYAIRDSAGTPVLSTALNRGTAGTFYHFDGTNVYQGPNTGLGSPPTPMNKIAISGNNPVFVEYYTSSQKGIVDVSGPGFLAYDPQLTYANFEYACTNTGSGVLYTASNNWMTLPSANTPYMFCSGYDSTSDTLVINENPTFQTGSIYWATRSALSTGSAWAIVNPPNGGSYSDVLNIRRIDFT